MTARRIALTFVCTAALLFSCGGDEPPAEAVLDLTVPPEDGTVAPVEVPTAERYAEVLEGPLNLREGPTIESAILVQMPARTRLEILSEGPAETIGGKTDLWYEVRTADGRRGYVSVRGENKVKELDLRGDCPALTGREAIVGTQPDTLQLTPDGRALVVAACDDRTLYAADGGGAEAWTVAPPPRTYARPGYRGVEPFQSRLTVAFDADLDQDGVSEIIVGSANWRAYVYDQAGELLWDEVLWAHTPTCGAAFDLDGDGKLELIMGNSYTSSVIYSWDGEILGSGAGSGHAGPTDIAAADLDGNGKGEMVTGDRAGMIWLQEWQGRDLPNYNAGSDITSVAIGDLTDDAGLEVAVASRNFLLYLFDADGTPLWQLNLGDVARDIQIADVTGDERPEIICACEDGTVKVVDGAGEVVAWYRAGAWMRQVRACELDGDPATAEIVATCDDGRIYGLQVAR